MRDTDLEGEALPFGQPFKCQVVSRIRLWKDTKTRAALYAAFLCREG
jgi:hypothetical protein